MQDTLSTTVVDTATVIMDTIASTRVDTVYVVANQTPTVAPGFSWLDFVTPVANTLIAGAALVTAYYARKGITSWMERKLSTEQHDLAIEILTNVYELVAYMDGALNSSILLAQGAIQLNRNMLELNPDTPLPWRQTITYNEWVTERANLINKQVCRNRALADEPEVKPDLNTLLSQTVMMFSAYMVQLHERVKSYYDPDGLIEGERLIDPKALQEGQMDVHIWIAMTESEFDKVYRPKRVNPDP